MTLLKDFDKSYRDSVRTTFDQLEKSYTAIANGYQFDLTKKEVTEAILERLKNYCLTQNLTKNFLNKRYQAPLADYFVETVLFFLRLYLKSQDRHLEAHSERQIKRTRNAIRPDISVWYGNEVVAIIECKTQLGWNRNGWEQDYISREQKLKEEFPKANSFLLAMTENNWGGFNNHSLLNSRFFSLLDNDTWISNYSHSGQILTPIELLFQQIK
ncbi:MAG: hypothetical protein QM594_12645 [Niabella sp.]